MKKEKLENLTVLINEIEQEIELNEQQIKYYEERNKYTHYIIKDYFEILINSLKLDNEKLKRIKNNFVESAKKEYPEYKDKETDGKRRKKKSKRKSKRKAKSKSNRK